MASKLRWVRCAPCQLATARDLVVMRATHYSLPPLSPYVSVSIFVYWKSWEDSERKVRLISSGGWSIVGSMSTKGELDQNKTIRQQQLNIWSTAQRYGCITSAAPSSGPCRLNHLSY